MSGHQKAFGKNIRRLRLLRKLTQEKLAEKSNLSLQHIGAIERGTGNPTFLCIERIAEALSVGIDELFALEELTRTPEEMRREIAARLDCMPEDAVLRLYVCSKVFLADV